MPTPAPGSTDCYPGFAAAIAACHQAGGGRVVIPAGDWYCAGPIVLLSNVNVHLNAGARIYFSNNPADYAKYGDYRLRRQRQAGAVALAEQRLPELLVDGVRARPGQHRADRRRLDQHPGRPGRRAVRRQRRLLVDLERQEQDHRRGGAGLDARTTARASRRSARRTRSIPNRWQRGAAARRSAAPADPGPGRRTGAPTRTTCRRCPKPACRWRGACSASATTCARR